MKTVLGVIAPDPVGQQLGTGFDRFTSPTGIEGLAKVNGDRLDVLAVNNYTERKGCFRTFITLCKLDFDTVCVWHITNPIVAGALIRYGFTPETEINAFGQTTEGMRWDGSVNKQPEP